MNVIISGQPGLEPVCSLSQVPAAGLAAGQLGAAGGLVAVRAGGVAAAGRHALVPHPRCPGTDVGQGENVTNYNRAVNEISLSLEMTPSSPC